ncbi:MAG: IS110 family transposase [Clostridia bacterium]
MFEQCATTTTKTEKPQGILAFVQKTRFALPAKRRQLFRTGRPGQPTMDLDAIVVNAAHMKALPGRKTDVKDAEWIADLLRHGLLKASYIPSREQRELREITRYRKSLTEERCRETNRLQKISGGRQHQIGFCGQRHQRKECQKAVGKDH